MFQVRLLPTLVSPEWTSAAASHLSNLQSCTCTEQLWQEAALLEQIIYKNINQHRNTRPFQRLLEVRRLLRLLQDAATDDIVCALRDALSLSSRPTLSLHERNVPTAESTLHVLQRVLGSCRLAESLLNATLTAAVQFTTQLAQSFFMPLSLTCLAILARVRVLTAQLSVDLIRIYNCSIELLALLPLETSTSSGNNTDKNSENSLFSSMLAKLPQMLQCSWTDGRPKMIESTIENNNSSPGGGGDDEYLEIKGIQRPQSIISEKLGSEGGQELTGNPKENPRQASFGGGASGLAVIEDRGVAVSREQLMAELRQNVAQTASLQTTIHTEITIGAPGTATTKTGTTKTITAAPQDLGPVAAIDTQPAPEYARTEVDLLTSNKERGVLKRKAEKMNKKALGPKIKIIPSESGDGDGASGGVSASGSLLSKPLKVSRPRVEPLPPRNTAFISVESLQKKPKVAETKKISENKEEKMSEGALASMVPTATAPTAAAVDDAPAAGVKSWEDWLAPLGSTEKKQQQQGGGSSKKKARRR